MYILVINAENIVWNNYSSINHNYTKCPLLINSNPSSTKSTVTKNNVSGCKFQSPAKYFRKLRHPHHFWGWTIDWELSPEVPVGANDWERSENRLIVSHSQFGQSSPRSNVKVPACSSSGQSNWSVISNHALALGIFTVDIFSFFLLFYLFQIPEFHARH